MRKIIAALMIFLLVIAPAQAEVFLGHVWDFCTEYRFLFTDAGAMLRMDSSLYRISDGADWFSMYVDEPQAPSDDCIGNGESYLLVDALGNIVSSRLFNGFGAAFPDRISYYTSLSDDDRLYGIIDSEANDVVAPKYANLQRFGDSHFYSVNERNEILIVDKDGNETLTGRLMPEGMFSWSYYADCDAGMLPAMDAATGKMGYIDTAGAWAIEPQFDQAGMFRDGYAQIRSGDANGPVGLIDTEGTVIVPALYSLVRVGHSIIAQRSGDSVTDVYSRSGEKRFSCEGMLDFWGTGFYAFRTAQMLDSDGLPVCSVPDGYSVYTDGGCSLSEGQLMYLRAQDGKRFLLDPDYHLLSPGYADIDYGCATADGEIYIVSSGSTRTVAASQTDSGCGTDAYTDGRREACGLADPYGNILVPCVYEEIEPVEDSAYFAYYSDGFIGVMDAQGNGLLEFPAE